MRSFFPACNPLPLISADNKIFEATPSVLLLVLATSFPDIKPFPSRLPVTKGTFLNKKGGWIRLVELWSLSGFCRAIILPFNNNSTSSQLLYTFTSLNLSLIHISEPTRQAEISYAVFCLKKKKKK